MASALFGCNPMASQSTIESEFHPGVEPSSDPDNQSSDPVAFTQAWPFDALSEASYSFDTSKLEFSGGVCRLRESDQVDSDSDASGFGGGTHSGTTWDATHSFHRLGNAGGCNGTSANCAHQTAASVYQLGSGWTPKWANIVGYWKFDEAAGVSGAGSIKDSSELTTPNHGTPTGTTTFGAAGILGTG